MMADAWQLRVGAGAAARSDMKGAGLLKWQVEWREEEEVRRTGRGIGGLRKKEGGFFPGVHPQKFCFN